MEKYLITGSLGHIGKPIVEGLIKAGKKVSVITRDPNKAKEIESLGAQALVGSIDDSSFVTSAFKNVDVVYTMIPPIWNTDNWRKSQQEIALNYAEAVKANDVKYVVNLSSLGAEQPEGNGPVDGVHDLEQLLNKIDGLNVKHLRPALFYYNFYNQLGLIKQAGIMGANYGNDDQPLFLVDHRDIADAALEELLSLNFKGSSVRNIVSDERTGKEIAEVLGKAIGKEVPWVIFTDEQQKEGLLQAGLPLTHAEGFTQMGVALRTGKMNQEARRNKPAFSNRKLEGFAKEFAEAFRG